MPASLACWYSSRLGTSVPSGGVVPERPQLADQVESGMPTKKCRDRAHVILFGDLVGHVLCNSVLGDVDRLQAGVDIGGLVELDGVILLLDGGASVLKEVGLPLGNGEDTRKSLL